jgi:hypothetical protein
MAYVESIYIYPDHTEKEFGINVSLKPAGKVRLKFTLPDGFFDTIVEAAQAAADLHEQQMKAEILTEKKGS